jgi:hypothetical protein
VFAQKSIAGKWDANRKVMVVTVRNIALRYQRDVRARNKEAAEDLNRRPSANVRQIHTYIHTFISVEYIYKYKKL